MSENDIDIDIDDLDDLDDLDDDDDEDIEDDGEEEEDDDDDDDIKTISKSKLKYKIIADSDRRTSSMLSLYEMCNVIGTRADMINSSTKETIYIDLNSELDSAIKIAEEEIKRGKCPLKIERIIKQENNLVIVELWDVNELIKPDIL
uniref:RNA polymerase Rpb6 n=1 Tax=viral metagenome TaxID=1070528 RepID=A0A6C0LJU4_9ZZZZ